MKERQNMDPADQIAARATTDIEAIPFHPNPTGPVARDDIAFDNDIPEVSTNAQPLPADSLVAPAVLDPHHFRVGDAIQFGYDPGEGASWEAIATAFGLLRAVDPKAAMDVSFWVDEQGRVLIDPMWICTTFEVPPELAASVDDLLVASGRPRRYIHDRVHDEPSDARTGWMVAC